MTTTTLAIPDQSSPWITRIAPTASNQDTGKLAIRNPQGIRIRDNTVIGTWNVRTMSATGKMYELIYELKIYQWMITDISEMTWKDNVEIFTNDGHNVYFSGSANKHVVLGSLSTRQLPTVSWDARQYQVESSPSV